MKHSLRLALVFLFFSVSASAQQAESGIALHGGPKYGPDFQHFDYVNANAPEGGDLHMSAIGTFSTLNPYSLLGMGSDGAAGASLVFETLMASSLDEPQSEYASIAESVTIAPDRSWVSYKLRPIARFHDGSPITAEDVLFSFNTLRDKGHPFFGSYYKDVVKAEILGPQEVKFTFRDTTNTELPMIVGQLPILSKKSWEGKDFSANNLEKILGSGPYEIIDVKPGSSITYAKVKNWWAKDLPINRGRYNFSTIRYDYYKDTTVAHEAFMAGQFDAKVESTAKFWATAYTAPAVEKGWIKKEAIRNYMPQGMQAFFFNVRRPLFQDRRVREALNDAFDFEWTNKSAAYSAYKRLNSYFENSELAGHGLPSPAELKLLEPLRGQIPDEVFTQEFKNPTTDGSGVNRDNIRKAGDLLRQAGWTLKNDQLVDKTGKPFSFEIITDQPMFERWVNPWIANLKLLGIRDVTFRIVDASQFQARQNDFNFDVIITTYGQSISPGNEQRDYFNSANADIKGSKNLIGIKDPAIDTLVGFIIHANSREDLIAACRALDRVLMWRIYGVSNWYIDSYRTAYWDLFGRPAINPPYGLPLEDTWWIDAAKAPKMRAAQGRK